MIKAGRGSKPPNKSRRVDSVGKDGSRNRLKAREKSGDHRSGVSFAAKKTTSDLILKSEVQ
jgi:hypothetical protein